MKHLSSLTLGLLALLIVGSPAAQSYPAKPIRVVVPYPAGGTSDILTRMVGVKFTESWGQQVIADVRPGANGNIGVEIVTRAAPDGYTLVLMDIGNLSISPSMYKLPFDIIRDLAPITTVTFSPGRACPATTPRSSLRVPVFPRRWARSGTSARVARSRPQSVSACRSSRAPRSVSRP